MKSVTRWFVSSSLTLSALVVSIHASASESTTDHATREARERFREGVALYDRASFEAASVKFKEAYALKRHHDVLLNIGWSCLRAGRRDEARDAFRDYLRVAGGESPEKRARAERGLEEAGADRPTETTTSPIANEAPGDVSAADVPAERPLRIDGLIGFTSQNLGLSIASRVGKIAFSRVHLGATFVYHVGRSISAAANVVAAESSYSAFVFGPEAGYEVNVRSFLVRPFVGIGVGSFVTTGRVTGGPSVSASVTELVFWAGGTASYDIPATNFTVGVDARLAFVPTGTALAALAAGGVRF